jgi:asparagine synthase (glutamine-hydrolysing)
MGVPIILQPTKGEEEKELEDLDAGLLRAVNEFKAQGVVSGALKSQYQRYRIDKACMKYALGVYAPLWKMDEAKEAELLISRGYKIVFSAVAAEGLDESWLGKPFDRAAVERLRSLGVSLVGEGGEFETLVLDCPMFKKRLHIVRSHAVKEGANTARLVVDEAALEKKQ